MDCSLPLDTLSSLDFQDRPCYDFLSIHWSLLLGHRCWFPHQSDLVASAPGLSPVSSSPLTCTRSLGDPIQPQGLNGHLHAEKFTSPDWIAFLNSRLIDPTAYLIPLLWCLKPQICIPYLLVPVFPTPIMALHSCKCSGSKKKKMSPLIAFFLSYSTSKHLKIL